MTVLALDTSGTSATAAIINEYIIMAEFSVTLASLKGEGRKTHSETIMPMVNQLFEVSGVKLNSIDRIACTCGPGSFTGLRIGASIAKGLAFATSKPLIAVPTLDAMAYNIECEFVVPMMDARRGQVYSAIYQNGRRISDYMALPKEELLDMVDSTKTAFVESAVRASAVGAIALDMPEAQEADFTLMYIRKPQAEREREERNAKNS